MKRLVKDCHKRLKSLVDGNSPENVYNMDETGLYHTAMPDRTLCVSGESVHGGKKMKDRLTVMQSVNMTGDFEKPFIIGKAQT